MVETIEHTKAVERSRFTVEESRMMDEAGIFGAKAGIPPKYTAE